MMLEWIGESQAAETIRSAVERTLEAGHLTPDLGGRLTTTQMAARMTSALAG